MKAFGRPSSRLGIDFDVDAEIEAHNQRELALLLRVARDEELLHAVVKYVEGFEARAQGLLALLADQEFDEATRRRVDAYRRLEIQADADLFRRAPLLRLVMSPERWAKEEAKQQAARETRAQQPFPPEDPR